MGLGPHTKLMLQFHLYHASLLCSRWCCQCWIFFCVFSFHSTISHTFLFCHSCSSLSACCFSSSTCWWFSSMTFWRRSAINFNKINIRQIEPALYLLPFAVVFEIAYLFFSFSFLFLPSLPPFSSPPPPLLSEHALHMLATDAQPNNKFNVLARILISAPWAYFFQVIESFILLHLS